MRTEYDIKITKYFYIVICIATINFKKGQSYDTNIKDGRTMGSITEIWEIIYA